MRSATILIVLSATVTFASQPAAVNHTANFAGQSWSSDRSNAAAAGSNYDRYGQPTSTSGSAVGPPPSISSRAQQAFNETGTTLRDGVDAGIRAANEQLQNVGNNLKSTAEQTFGRYNDQLQPISPIGTTTSSPAPSTTSRPKNGVSPPPWSTSSSSTAPSFSTSSSAPSTTGQSVDRTFAPGMVPTRTHTGWTSIGSGVAAPPLLIPPLPAANTQSRLAVNNNGPTFPSILDAQKADGPQSRSLLVNNPDQPASRSTTNDWASGWNNNNNVNNKNNADTGATISRSNNNTTNLNSNARNSDLVAVDRSNVNANSQENRSRQTGTNWDDPWGGADSWSGQDSQRSGTGSGQTPGISAAQQPPGNSANPLLAGNSQSQSPPAPAAANTAIAGSVPVAATPASSNVTLPKQNPDAQAAAGGQPQWMTLAVVLLSLVGSLSANVFLGMSYMDARQKYQSLVRRTADSFRRSSPTAA